MLASLVPSNVVRTGDVVAHPAADLLRLDALLNGVLLVLGLEMAVESATVGVSLAAELAAEVLAVLALVSPGGRFVSTWLLEDEGGSSYLRSAGRVKNSKQVGSEQRKVWGLGGVEQGVPLAAVVGESRLQVSEMYCSAGCHASLVKTSEKGVSQGGMRSPVWNTGLELVSVSKHARGYDA